MRLAFWVVLYGAGNEALMMDPFTIVACTATELAGVARRRVQPGD